MKTKACRLWCLEACCNLKSEEATKMITAHAAVCLLILVSVECKQQILKSGQLAVIRDKVTPEEISEVILNPRKRDVRALESYDNKIHTEKLRGIDEQKNKKSIELKRELRAVRLITTRLRKSTQEQEVNPDDYTSQNRLKRIVYTRNNRKPKPLPAAFLTAVARVVVPARPELSDQSSSPESVPRLLRLHEVKRGV